ncbi:DUF1467 family protein [Novosphingobium mangrovi (ex Huang et al. 2023)]|uniref:DUF1467 family protein n=1 Tax=Novosphingobium mangrovi (ex Huang et al. 2023) TaxID=2976432 RepID=A0ABT2I4J3_9SPHN|nr:DUF1467 family protein [Novosphingobium mangrovi (ex Huang et al. 2023)]MCT2399507.1 DUF1467 family protein [Novosphingobium mangrovi (ex Huang et al. 2023)]
MQWFSILAIYGLFWVLSAFLVMPFGLRTPDESGDKVQEGHADSAPVNFRPRKILLRATLLAAVLFVVYYENYVNGWITLHDLNFFGDPPVKDLGY